MAKSSCVFLVVIFLVVATKYHVISSPSQINPPSASPSFLPSTIPSKSGTDGFQRNSADEEPPRKNANNANANNPPPSRPKSSSIAFLYELYEHEIYTPKTDSWTSRRFTQSPITGGGGRDSTSLNPQSCTPPRNYLFDGEWKIDMATASRDGFGWEYYVGKYDGLGRRRRRWVRTLKRVSSSSGGMGVTAGSKLAAKKKLMDAKKKKSTTLSKESASKTYHPNVFRAIRDQYNFKGFGWTFYKSLLFRRAFGAAFRIPISANFDFYDRHLAAPYISSATYFGYPWVAATFLNASIPKEAVVWLMDGVLWKVRWGLALVSALVRGFVEAVIWIVLGPWRLWRASLQMMGLLVSRVPQKREEDIANLLIDTVEQAVDEDATKSIIQSGEGTSVSIETHIEINNTSECKANGEMPAVSATAVADTPRGGASNTTEVSSFRKRHLTISGKEIPTFHRPTSLEYSSTVQERIAICFSWRVSQLRGYEFRVHYAYTCLPTFLFWRQLEDERKRRAGSARRFVGVWGKRNDPSSAKFVGTIEADKIQDKDAAETKSLSSSRSKSPSKSSKTSAVSSFFSEHSSTLGMSAGWPMPIDPYFSFNLMLVLSSFYYGWLLKYIRSFFVLPTPQRSKDKESLGQNATISSTDNDSLSASSQKLVSKALKKEKMPLGDTNDMVETDDLASITNSTQVDLGNDLENCTGAELNVAGF